MRRRPGLLVYGSLALCTCVGCSSGGGILDTGPAVVTVGASNADYASIQNAVDDAQPGTTIQIASGSYSERVVIDKALTLIGAGSSTIISLPTGTIGKGAIEVNGARGVRIQNLTVIAPTFDVDGIHIDDSTDVAIIAVVVSETGDEGVHVEGSSDVMISGIFTNNDDHGIHVREGSTRVTISNVEASGNAKDGIRFTESTDSIVMDSVVSQNGDEGIMVRTACSGIVIAANESHLNGGHGIRVRESTGGSVTGNVSTQNSRTGIFVTQPPSGEPQVLVEDNTAFSNGDGQEIVD